MSNNIDFQGADVDTPALAENNQFNSSWKDFFRSIKNFLDAYVTSSGMLPAELTTAQRDSIVAPRNNTIISNTTTGELQVYQGGSWKVIQVV